MHFTVEFWFQIAVYVIGGLVFVAINAFYVGRIMADFVTKTDLEKKVKERDEKILRVYERLDTHKAYIDGVFTRKDICSMAHIALNDQNSRWEKSFADFRHDVRTMVQKVFDSNEAIKDSMHEFKEEILKLVGKT